MFEIDENVALFGKDYLGKPLSKSDYQRNKTFTHYIYQTFPKEYTLI